MTDHRQPLDADASRQASDAIRGFDYQVWRTVHAWIVLKNDEALFVECAEDFEIVGSDGARAIQVKDTKGSGGISLNQKRIAEALESYLDLRRRNPSQRVELVYVTTAPCSAEQGQTFGEGQRGVEVWEACRLREAEEVDESLAAINSMLRENVARNGGEREFPQLARLVQTYQQAVIAELVRSVTWLFNSPEQEAVRNAVELLLIEHGSTKGAPAAEARRVADHLYQAVLSQAIRRPPEPLTRGAFLDVFEAKTMLSVPRAMVRLDIQAGQSAQQQLTTDSAPTPGLVASDLGYGTPPPDSAAHLYRRRPVVDEVCGKLSDGRFVWLVGSTGCGKTTTVLHVCETRSARPFWFDLRELTTTQVQSALALATTGILVGRAGDLVVVENVDVAGDFRGIESHLATIAFAARASGISLVLTSYGKLPPRIASKLKVLPEQEYEIPAWGEEEVTDYACSQGCETSTAQSWSRLILGKTAGHPQLIEAHLQDLKSRGFPPLANRDLLAEPANVADVLTEAQTLIREGLPAPTRSLLYLLSVTSRPFRRALALRVAAADPSISMPGEEFDRLCGPWFEKYGNGYFKVSPLAAKAAEGVFPDERLTEIHKTIGQAVLRDGTLSTVDAATGFFHAVLARDEWTIIRIINALDSADKRARKHFSDEVSWVVMVGRSAGDKLPVDSEGGRQIFRLTQLNVASLSGESALPRLVQLIDEEYALRRSDDESSKLFRLLFLVKLMTLPVETLSPKDVLAKGLEFVELVNQTDDAVLRELHLEDARDAAWALLLSRVRSLDSLEELFAGLDDEDVDRRERLLAGFNTDDGPIRLMLGNAWLNQTDEAPGDVSCKVVFEKIHDRAVAWGCVPLQRAMARALAVELDESLGDHKAAEKLIHDTAAKIGWSPSLEDQLAIIKSRHDEHKSAVEIWQRILPQWDAGGDVAPVFACKYAGGSAGALREWSLARQMFLDGARRAEALGLLGLRVGFLADAGHAAWKDGSLTTACNDFLQAVTLMDEQASWPSDRQETYAQRAVGHLLTSLAGDDLHLELGFQEPNLGFCSNNAPEAAGKLPRMATDVVWLALVRLEMVSGGTGVHIAARERLATSRVPEVAAVYNDSLVARCFRVGEFEELMLAAARTGMSVHRAKQADRGPLEISQPMDDEAVPAEAPPRDVVTYPLLAALFIVRHQGGDVSGLVSGWVSQSRTLGGAPEVQEWANGVLHALSLDRAESTKLLLDNRADPVGRVIAAIQLLHDADSEPERIFYAQVMWGMWASSEKRVRSWTESATLDLVRRQWLELSAARFLLRAPQVTAPAIVHACESSATGWSKVADILGAARGAVNVRMPADFSDALERMRVGPK